MYRDYVEQKEDILYKRLFQAGSILIAIIKQTGKNPFFLLLQFDKIKHNGCFWNSTRQRCLIFE